MVLAGVIWWQQHRYDSVVKEKDTEIKAMYTALNTLQSAWIEKYEGVIEKTTKAVADVMSNSQGMQKTLNDFIQLLQLRKE